RPRASSSGASASPRPARTSASAAPSAIVSSWRRANRCTPSTSPPRERGPPRYWPILSQHGRILHMSTRSVTRVVSPLLAMVLVLAAGGLDPAPADETCQSPFLPQVTGQEDY